MSERDLLADQWQQVAEALGIRFARNKLVRAADGTTHEFAVLLPQFGAPMGTLVDTEYERAAMAAARESGYACSSMSAETHYVPIDPLSYVECLAEWGWSSTEESPPGWYAEAAAKLSDKDASDGPDDGA